MTVATETLLTVVDSPVQDGAYNYTVDSWDESHIRVRLTGGEAGDVTLTYGEDYTVTPSGRATARVVTLLADPGDATQMLIDRATVVAQESAFVQTAKGFEYALDRLTMSVQERQGEYLDSVLGPIGVQGLRIPEPEPNRAIIWNAAGTALVLGELGSATPVIAGNVLDFEGVYADGVTDSTTGLRLARNWAEDNDAPLYWPPGTYYASGAVDRILGLRNEGPGVFKQGARLWYITPGVDQVNTIYVDSVNGSDFRNGADETNALGTIEAARDILRVNASKLNGGQWKIRASGEFRETVRWDDIPMSALPILLEGDTRAWLPWTTATAYVTGDIRANSAGMLYIAVGSGTSGATEPTAGHGTQSDGGVTWWHLIGHRPFAAGATVTALQSYRHNGGYLYLALDSGTTGATAPTHVPASSTASSGWVDSDGTIDWLWIGTYIAPQPLEPLTVIDGSRDPKLWVTGTAYRPNDAVYFGANCYLADNYGTSGGTAPTHTSGNVTDGGVVWRYNGARTVVAGTIGLWFQRGINISVNGFHWKNMQEADNSSGILNTGHGELRVTNCRGSNCQFGALSVRNLSIANSAYSIYDFNEYGHRWQYFVVSTLQYCALIGNETGFFAGRQSQGHVDYCMITGKPSATWAGIGVGIDYTGRLNILGNHFRNLATPIFSNQGAQYDDNRTILNAYYVGITEARNGRYGNVSRGTGGDTAVSAVIRAPGLLMRDLVGGTFTADGGTAGVASIVRILADTNNSQTQLPRYSLTNNDKSLHVDVRGEITGTTDTKALDIRLPAATLIGPTVIPSGTTGPYRFTLDAMPLDSEGGSLLCQFTFECGTYATRGEVIRSPAFFDANGVWQQQTVRVVATLASGDGVTVTRGDVWVQG